MRDLQNTRTEWNISEKIALHVRKFNPEVYEAALDAIAKEEIEKYSKQKNK